MLTFALPFKIIVQYESGRIDVLSARAEEGFIRAFALREGSVVNLSVRAADGLECQLSKLSTRRTGPGSLISIRLT